MRFWSPRLTKIGLAIGVALVGVTVLAASLRRRPDIEPPRGVHSDFSRDEFPQTLQALNASFDAWAAEAGVQVAPPADNLTIMRRLSLALVGTGMSLEEIRAVERVPEDRQLRWWVNHLLEDRRWSDYFAERLSRAYVGTNEGPFLLFRRRKFNLWLAEQLRGGTPYDQIVREMLSAEGLWTDTPQVNFITATMDQEKNRADPIRLAGRTSRAFLAQRIDCLQCHDDFLGELNFGTSQDPIDGRQEHFHQLAAFFAGTGLPDPVFRGIREDGREYRYKYLHAEEEETVSPAVPFYPDLLPQEGKPRARLARWVTHPENRAFARATVNRIWALMTSRPLVAPVDSIPLDGSLPEPLEILAEDFRTHGFDLRRLVRLIAMCNAMHRDSRAEFDITEAHEECWAVFPLSQLRPEQVAGNVMQASKLTAIDQTSSIFTRLKAYGDLQDFLKRFGDRGEDEFEADAVTISQRLVLMNGKLTRERTKNDLVNNAASRIAKLVGDDTQAIELAFLSVLNRYPSTTELEVFRGYLNGKSGNARARALGDVYWAMINSTEFSWNH
ncbi:MAG: DUF1553 domain-containing protein [Planctomycetota bacterium]|nr:MAG: DUF1553 domain-containing protein [Planctomycetota bacterium]